MSREYENFHDLPDMGNINHLLLLHGKMPVWIYFFTRP